MILQALDVAQDRILVALGDQAHGDASDRIGDRHPRVHQGQGAAAHRGHRGRAVRGEHLGYDPQCVGEFALRRKDRFQGCLGKRAVTDLAPLGTAHGPGLAGAKGWEVVVVHVALGLFRSQRVQPLYLARGAQGGNAHRLSLTPGKEPRSVRPGQEPCESPDVADLVGLAAIGPLTFFQDQSPGFGLEHVTEYLLDILGIDRLILGKGAQDLVFQGIRRHISLFLAHRLDDQLGHPVADAVDDPFLVPFFDGGDGVVGVLGFADLGSHLLLKGNQRLHRLVPHLERLDDDFFLDLLGARLHHQDGVFGAGHAQIQAALLQLVGRGVDDELVLEQADAAGGDRSLKGDIRDGQGRRCADDGRDIQIVLAIGRQGGDDDLNVIAIVLGKERSQGTVDQAHGEDSCFAGAPFPAEKAARDASCGVQPFFKVHGQGEKVNPLARLL